MKSTKFIFWGWVAAAIGMFLYSFTQVDLSLTLSASSIFQTIQKAFQYVGWFNRPLSTLLYSVVILFMFALYFWTLFLIRKQQLSINKVFKIVTIVGVILLLAYNAFSYDIFNYIFDAKIVTSYHQNPYEHKALDYPSDPMLSFMRWTHRTYPYGPVWLGITIPLSFAGFGYFIVTFYLFKLLALTAYLWSARLIKKIADNVGVDPAFAVAAFALNPLVLVESLVSAHNDIVMIALALFAVLAFLKKDYIQSFAGILASVLVKFATAFLAPAILARGILKVDIDKFFYILVASMSAAALFATLRTNFQPWYLLLVLPFAVFVQQKYFIAIPVFILSFAALLQYIPYLYTGNWNEPIPTILNSIMVGSIFLSGALVLIYHLRVRNQ